MDDPAVTVNDFQCPVCCSHSIESVQLYLAKSSLFKDRKLMTCKDCNTKSIYPLNVNIEYYQDNYWDEATIKKRACDQYAQALARYEFIRKHINSTEPLSVLDVGAGLGFFNKIIKGVHNGTITYEAVEVNPAAIDFLKTHLDAGGIFQSLPKTTGKYGLILLFHILEHISDPHSFLMQIKALLSDSGLIFIEIPNKDWQYKKRNEPHIVFYNQDSLKILMKRCGFEIMLLSECGREVNAMMNDKKMASGQASSFDRLMGHYYNIKSKMFCSNVYSDYGRKRQWIRILARKL